MMLAPEGPAALPLWINGHAFLTVTKNFHTVTNPTTGSALRLAPLCGADELALAVNAAQTAYSDWSSTSPETRATILEKIAVNLEKYAAHFAKILQEETALDESAAQAEVSQAYFSLRQASSSIASLPSLTSSSPQVVLMDASQPLAKPVDIIANALASGNTVIIKTSVKAPGALFAIAELTARADLPPGVFNLLHGDDEIIAAIALSPELTNIAFMGESAIADKIQTQLNLHQKQLVLG